MTQRNSFQHAAGRPAGQGFVEEVSRLREGLETLKGLTEREFLAIGERLNDFHRRSHELAQQATSVASTLLEESATDAVGGLQLLVMRLRQHREVIQETIEQEAGVLVGLGAQLHAMEEPLGAFRRIVRTLQSLGIATRVEGARNGCRESWDVAFADELKELAGLIGTRTEFIDQRLEDLAERAGRAALALEKMQQGEGGRSEQLLETAEVTLEALVLRTREATRQAGALSARTREFARQIGEVVASLQFQDIVRQKIEHVQAALGELRSAGEEHPSDLLLLQAAHLQLAIEEMEEAGGRIVHGFTRLGEEVGELGVQAARAVGLEDATGVPVSREIEEIVAAVSQLLQAGMSIRQESSDAVAQVAVNVGELSQMVGEIDLLGEKMKVVALNAGIRAVHGGREGAALGVIAESIQQLSAQALDRTRTLGDGFRRILVLAGELGREAEEQERPEDLTADAAALIERLQGINGDLAARMAELSRANSALLQDLEETARQVTVHHQFSREGGEIRDDLGRLAGTPAGGAADSTSLAEHLFARYTMQSERKVHQAQTGQVIDLRERRALRRGSELGDNVELF